MKSVSSNKPQHHHCDTISHCFPKMLGLKGLVRWLLRG